MRITQIDVLRGIAAVLVVLFHLEKGAGLTPATYYFEYGYTGVQIFFVISGFILPYSLYKSNYQEKNFGTFLLKRIIRIHPAYIAAILIGIILAIVTGRDLPPKIAMVNQIFFINSFWSQPFSSAVFWTLAIEFQFYILIALLYPVIGFNFRLLGLIAIGTAIAFFIRSDSLVFKWLPFFSMGMLIFNFRCRQLPSAIFWTATATLILFTAFFDGIAPSFAATFAVLFILFVQFEKQTVLHKFLLFLGTVSYSLYLTHWDLGRMAVRMTRHIPVIAGISEIRLFLGLVASVLFAWLLYVIVEKPSARLSSRFKYKNT